MLDLLREDKDPLELLLLLLVSFTGRPRSKSWYEAMTSSFAVITQQLEHLLVLFDILQPFLLIVA